MLSSTLRRTMSTISPAKIVKTESYRLSGGFKIIDRWFDVPLDYDKPADEKIRVFARNAVPNKENDDGEKGGKLPFFLYLQGGPGYECSSPKSFPLTEWLFEKGYQMLYLDQRGTGLSTPISANTLSKRGDAQAQADYVSLFRADNIVRDSEAIRLALLGDKEKPEDRKWSLIGQSFGGFCATTYLSFYPEGLKEVFTTGGIPPISATNPDLIYEKTFEALRKRNHVFYEKYPQDIKRVRDIVRYLDGTELRLPSGGILSPERFLDLGISFGMHGGIDNIHMMVQRAASELEIFGEFSFKMLQSIEEMQSYDKNPIYAIAHEVLYCQGEASDWSAERIKQKQDSHFQWKAMLKKSDDEPVYFTGEMIFPSMFRDYSQLVLLKPVAEKLAEKKDWPKLYDVEQLKKNEVPVYAATYVEDMYVDYELARETAAEIKGTKEYITNVWYHSALRHKLEGVMGELWKLKSEPVD